MATPAPENDRPSYLSSPGFVSLTRELNKLGYGLGYTPTHLLVDVMRFPHEMCIKDADHVIALIVARFERSAPIAQPRTIAQPQGIGLPGYEYTSGGQHISERSG